MNNLQKIFFIMAVFLLSSCVQDTFTSQWEVTPEMAQPKDLRYATLIKAYEKGAIVSNSPTVETGGLIPEFEIVAGYDGDGNQLDDSYMDYVSIDNPYNVALEDTVVLNYRNAGRVEIKSGHPFVFQGGEYSFDIAVKTVLNEQEYTTVFKNAFKFSCLPNLPSKILFVPMGQNLIVGDDAHQSTKEPSIGMEKANYRFSLASCTDVFDINPETGVISLKPGVTVTEPTTYHPSIQIQCVASEETKLFEGSETLLTVVVSNEKVEMPLQKNFFFKPIFGTDVADYKTIIITAGNATSIWTSRSADISAIKPNYPLESASMPTVQITITGTDKTSKKHESWFILKSQDLSSFSYGFDLKAEFWLSTNYVTYDFNTGLPCSTLTPMISTTFDFDSNQIDETQWQDISGSLVYNIYNQNGTLKTASKDMIPGVMPYPGDQKVLTATSADGVTAVDNYQEFKNPIYSWKLPLWMKCELDLTPYKDMKNVTIAFRAKCDKDYENITNIDKTTTFQRGGTYYLDGVVYTAQEKE